MAAPLNDVVLGRSRGEKFITILEGGALSRGWQTAIE